MISMSSKRTSASGNAAEPHGRLAPANLETLGFVADRDEAAYPFFFAVLIENPGEHEVEPRHAATSDPVFLPVDHEPIAAAVGACRHLAGGAAGTRLGDADCGLVTGEHEIRGEPLLRIAAVFHDGANRAHVGLNDDTAGSAAPFRHLLDDEDCIEVAGPYPAIARRDRHAEEPRLLEQRDIIPRIFFAPVNLGRAGGDRATRQCARLGL